MFGHSIKIGAQAAEFTKAMTLMAAKGYAAFKAIELAAKAVVLPFKAIDLAISGINKGLQQSIAIGSEYRQTLREIQGIMGLTEGELDKVDQMFRRELTHVAHTRQALYQNRVCELRLLLVDQHDILHLSPPPSSPSSASDGTRRICLQVSTSRGLALTLRLRRLGSALPECSPSMTGIS